MHVLRHDDITGNHKEIAPADALQPIFKQIHGCGGRQVSSTAITAEGKEVNPPVC
jgi:hypothetical protein